MIGIALRNISKSYPNGPRVLHDVSLDIRPGELVVRRCQKNRLPEGQGPP